MDRRWALAPSHQQPLLPLSWTFASPTVTASITDKFCASVRSARGNAGRINLLLGQDPLHFLVGI